MRIVIREYLSMLRESGELDSLLPDLLLAMGIEPLTRPGRGNRQFGVDIPAAGTDPDDDRTKFFAFTVKRGNITRAEWNGGPQSVRPSLDEILDSYLHRGIRPEHAELPKKVVLVTGGELRPEVEPNWRDYVAANRNRYPALGEVEFDFWGGDKLALLIERYLMDEYLFPESAQKALRKTIALADQNEDEPRHFYALIDETLFDRGLPVERTAAAERQRQKALRLLNLSLNIVFHWCQEAGNLRPAIFCAERAVLRAWDWMRISHLLDDQSTRVEYGRIFDTYLAIVQAYEEKVRPACLVRDGLFGHGGDEVEYPLRCFEVIGILGTLTMSLVYVACHTDDEDARGEYLDRADRAAVTLESLVANNPGALSPAFDEQGTDLALGILPLVLLGRKKAASDWLEGLLDRVVLAFRLGRSYPISTDSYEDLVAFRIAPDSLPLEYKKKLKQLSTLLPMAAEWLAILELHGPYSAFRQLVATELADIDLQLWYPDQGTDEHLYRENAGHESGYTLTSLKLPERLEQLSVWMYGELARVDGLDQISCVSAHAPALGLIASRHFRTPVIPGYWRELLPVREVAAAESIAEAIDSAE